MASRPLPAPLSTGILIIAGTVIWLLYAWKAHHASITHDEAGTYFNGVIQDFSMWSCHWNPRCWGDANNHILNTLLMRWSVDLFGVSEFSLRLPNLLTFALFLGVCGAIALRLGRTVVAAVCIYCILTLNPYNLDFFGLARGYGMGLGWMMASLYCVWRHTHSDTPQWQWIAAAFTAAALSVMSNLTFAAYFVALGGLTAIYLLCVRRHTRQVVISSIGPLVIAGFLVWYFDTPVALLSESGEFHYGLKSLSQSWIEYMRNNTYGINYFGSRTAVFVAWLVAALLVLSALSIFLDKSQTAIRRFGRAMVIVTIMMVLFFFLNLSVMDANVPSGRKAIIYGPTASLILAMGIRRVPRKYMLQSVVMTVVSALLLYHMVRTWDPATYREWWYDADTRNVVEYVAEHSARCDQDPLLATEWIFHPAAHFYIAQEFDGVTLAAYSREVNPEAGACFYYVHPEHAQTLEAAYDVEHHFHGRQLFRRKE